MSSGRKSKLLSSDCSIVYSLALALYFFVAPFEDMLVIGGIGTLAKYLAVVIIGLGAMMVLYTDRTARFDYLQILPLILVVLMWVSVFWSVSLNTTVVRLSAYTTVPLLFVVVATLPYTRFDYELIENAALLGGIVLAVYLFFTQGSEIMRARLTLNEGNDPNNLAALIYLPLSIAIHRVFDRRGIRRFGYFAITVVLLFFILLTGSRGALLTITVFLLIYLFLQGYIRRPRMIIMVIILILVSVFIVYRYLPKEIILRLFSEDSYLGDMQSKGETRSNIWKTLFTKVFPEMSLWGFGAGCVPVELGRFLSSNRAAHNTYFNIFGELGIFGLPIFLAFLTKLLQRLKRHRLNYCFALLAGMLVCIFFLDSFAKKFFWNILMLCVIAINAFPDGDENNRAQEMHIRDKN